jgi:hypothetical protein
VFLALGFLQCGLVLGRLAAEWVGLAESRRVSLVIGVTIGGLLTPLAHLGLFFMALYWFCVQLGDRTVFLDVLDFRIGYRTSVFPWAGCHSDPLLPCGAHDRLRLQVLLPELSRLSARSGTRASWTCCPSSATYIVWGRTP